MRTSAFRVGTPNGMILLFASKPRSVLFFPLSPIRDSVAALRRVVSGWSANRKFGPCYFRVAGHSPGITTLLHIRSTTQTTAGPVLNQPTYANPSQTGTE
jgi:hypothetical protein